MLFKTVSFTIFYHVLHTLESGKTSFSDGKCTYKRKAQTSYQFPRKLSRGIPTVGEAGALTRRSGFGKKSA
ncbi:MAG: hypothetical protein A2901_09590 [Elusimicrobia bacterium RIFCSPLOWO2_01_FULL_54_10]|nr:MAG: hypothetical protein A2901_09590 [Elusimicrobia bacterium RIFCSPLOWO2_01_FULL_54_10]